MPYMDKPKMTALELTQTREFSVLSVRQGIWVLSYVQHFLDTGICDPMPPTKMAYKCKSDETARSFGYQVQANPKIRLVLHRFFGDNSQHAIAKTDRERLIATIRKQLRAAEPGSIAASRFVAQLERLLLGESDQPERAKDSQIEIDSTSAPNSRIPEGATPLADENGVVRGYKTADSQYVRLCDVEVSK
jgi:hypothetical protein